MDLDLDFNRNGFGQPQASGPDELGALAAFLTDDVSSASAAQAVLEALDSGGQALSGKEASLISLDGAVKVTHVSAGPPVYLSYEEFRALVRRWADFVAAPALA